MMRRQWYCGIVGLVCLLGALGASGQETAPPGKTKEPAFLLEQAQAYTIRRDGAKQPLKLKPEPIFNWTNPERLGHKGAVYVWLADERPEAIGSLFTYEIRGAVHEKHAFHSLSSRPLQSHLGDVLAWRPQAAGLTWQPLEGVTPAASARLRTAQMRKAAREFQCTLVDPVNGPTELRFLPQPIYEYSAPEADVLDGAIFAFVVATDPEALLVIEAGKEGWRYAFARFHYWELRAQRDGKDVWRVAADDQQYNRLGDGAYQTKIYNSYGVGMPKPVSR
jgi:hypothetical protein